jgi:hypothetical protein
MSLRRPDWRQVENGSELLVAVGAKGYIVATIALVEDSWQ